MSSTARLVSRAVIAAVVVALVGLAAVAFGGDGDDAATDRAGADGRAGSTTTSTGEAAPREASTAELAASYFPPAPSPEEARLVSDPCAANLEIQDGVPTADDPMAEPGATGSPGLEGGEIDGPMVGGHDHDGGGSGVDDVAVEERTAADGNLERVFGGINPRVETSSLAFDAAATAEDDAAAAAFVEEVGAVIEARGWEDPANAARDGYRPMQECNTHWVNIDAVLDGKDLDPEHPEFLVILPGRDGKNHFQSVMFMAGSNDGHGPQPFGPLAVWHYHAARNCMVDGIFLVASLSAECPEGTEPYERTPEMLHVRLTDDPFSPDM